jgi:hypothetical protein
MTSTLKLNGHEITISGRVIKCARLQEEWFEDVDDPDALTTALAGGSPRADIFTFWQRLPDTTARHRYYREIDDVAALPITTYEEWWTNQIKSRTRGLIRKSQKQGVVVREAEYTDDFVRGITNIFNETPIRQGRRFWHYGKDFETVKRQFSRYLFREKLIGAYFEGELIGFIMLGFADRYAVTSQIISTIGHRDKGPNNSLMSKAVEICAREGVPYLVYLNWGSGSLSEFKRRNGFQRISLPRYYVPLNLRGELALRLGLHKGLRRALPDSVLLSLKQLRTTWYVGVRSLTRRAAPQVQGEADV